MANSWTVATVKLFGAASLSTLMMTLSRPQNFGFARTTYESTTFVRGATSTFATICTRHPLSLYCNRATRPRRVHLLIEFSFLITLLRKGKSYWILYAVRRRLGEAKPFLWHFSKQWYLLVEDGVFQVPTGCLDPTLFARCIWAFVDVDHSPSGVPSDLTMGHS